MNQKRLSLTVKEIAKLSGFSKTTVSRVLSGSDLVKKEAKQEVLNVIKEKNINLI